VRHSSLAEGLVRTAAELLEKAQAFDALAATAQNDLLRATYLEIANNYRELAQLRERQPPLR
jgi:hypothetical protein